MKKLNSVLIALGVLALIASVADAAAAKPAFRAGRIRLIRQGGVAPCTPIFRQSSGQVFFTSGLEARWPAFCKDRSFPIPSCHLRAGFAPDYKG